MDFNRMFIDDLDEVLERVFEEVRKENAAKRVKQQEQKEQQKTQKYRRLSDFGYYDIENKILYLIVPGLSDIELHYIPEEHALTIEGVSEIPFIGDVNLKIQLERGLKPVDGSIVYKKGVLVVKLKEEVKAEKLDIQIE